MTPTQVLLMMLEIIAENSVLPLFYERHSSYRYYYLNLPLEHTRT